MPVFVTSTSSAKLHGVYALERRPPSVIRAQGTAVAGIVEQFPWGPVGTSEITEVSSQDMKSFIDRYAPPGMSHTGAGYLAVTGKSWPTLKVNRVLGPTAAAATLTINKTGPTALIVLALKYPGTAGNSVTATTSAATDGDANHFNLTVSVTGASGTTTDFIENLNYSAVGTVSSPDLTRCLLLGSITPSSTGVPILGTSSFTGGTDGTVTSAEYVGTQGAGDKGLSLFEADSSIDFVVTADPGNSLRAAVNAGLRAHADFMTDRIAVVNGNSGLTHAQVLTDVANYRSIRTIYVDVWAYVRDDVDGTERLVPPAPFFASVAASISPSTSPAWKSSVIRALLNSITRLETPRGASAGTSTDNGVVTLQKEPRGGFTFESAVNTNAPINPATRTYKRTRMGHYMAKAITASLRESVDAPNVPIVQQDEIVAVKDFLDELVRNRDTDPINLPHLAAAGIDDVDSFNSQTSLDAGQFFLPFSAKVSSDQEKIFLSMNYGETTTVSAVL